MTLTVQFCISKKYFSLKAPISEKAYLSIDFADWRFSQNSNYIYRLDTSLDFEYHFSRDIKTNVRILNYEYDNKGPDRAFNFLLTLSPYSQWLFSSNATIYLEYSRNKPVHDSIITILDSFSQDTYGIGLDIKACGGMGDVRELRE